MTPPATSKSLGGKRKKDQNLHSPASWGNASPGVSQQGVDTGSLQESYTVERAKVKAAPSERPHLDVDLIFDLMEEKCAEDEDDDLEIVAGDTDDGEEEEDETGKGHQVKGAAEFSRISADGMQRCQICSAQKAMLHGALKEAVDARLEATRLRGRELSGCTDEELYFISKTLEDAALRVAHG